MSEIRNKIVSLIREQWPLYGMMADDHRLMNDISKLVDSRIEQLEQAVAVLQEGLVLIGRATNGGMPHEDSDLNEAAREAMARAKVILEGGK